MAVSMTGYGMHLLENDRVVVKAEVRSVNNRYLEIHVRLPRHFSYLEEPIKRLVRNTGSRGKVEVYLHLSQQIGGGTKVHLDTVLAGEYHAALRLLKKTYRLSGKCHAKDLASFPGVVNTGEENQEQTYSEDILEAVERALTHWNEMRRTEGNQLEGDLYRKTADLEVIIGALDVLAQGIPGEYREKLNRRLAEIIGDHRVSEDRIAQEVVFLADRSCIEEELNRMKSHILQFRENMTRSACGKRLDFIVQEMHREINTIGSKTSSVEMTRHTLDCKCLIEQIREQVQNIE